MPILHFKFRQQAEYQTEFSTTEQNVSTTGNFNEIKKFEKIKKNSYSLVQIRFIKKQIPLNDNA